MLTKTESGPGHGDSARREGDIGVFQMMALGLLAFTVLMVLMAIVLSAFMAAGGWFA